MNDDNCETCAILSQQRAALVGELARRIAELAEARATIARLSDANRRITGDLERVGFITRPKP